MWNVIWIYAYIILLKDIFFLNKYIMHFVMRVCNNLIIICVCNICIVNLFWKEITWERYVCIYVLKKQWMNHLINQMLSELIFFVSEKKEYLSYDCVLFIFQNESQKLNKKTTFNGGSLGSCIDEERSQLRYVMWIAEISESSNFWTQIALLGPPGSMPVWVSRTPMLGDQEPSDGRLARWKWAFCREQHEVREAFNMELEVIW